MMPVILTTPFKPASLAYATLDPSPSRKTSESVLSNGNLTVTMTGNNLWRSVFSTVLHSTGKWYWEITSHAAATYRAVGIANIILQPGNYAGDITNYSWGYHASGNKFFSGTPISGLDTWQNAGNVIGTAVDLDAAKLWFSLNGVWQGVGADPATGTNPAYSSPQLGTENLGAMFSLFTFNDSMTANFGATPFVHSVPIGFNAGLYY